MNRVSVRLTDDFALLADQRFDMNAKAAGFGVQLAGQGEKIFQRLRMLTRLVHDGFLRHDHLGTDHPSRARMKEP